MKDDNKVNKVREIEREEYQMDIRLLKRYALLSFIVKGNARELLFPKLNSAH